MDIKGFQFSSSLALNAPQSFLGVLPPGINNTDVLLQKVAEVLNFPEYFGENWNALYDCLRDFSWVHEFSIVLIHPDLPSIPDKDLKIYLEVLQDSCLDWKEGDSHQLTVLFDKCYEKTILNLLSN